MVCNISRLFKPVTFRTCFDYSQEDLAPGFQEAVGSAVAGPQPAPAHCPGDAGEVSPGQGRGPGAGTRGQPGQGGGQPQEEELALGGQEVLRHPGGGRGQQGEHH